VARGMMFTIRSSMKVVGTLGVTILAYQWYDANTTSSKFGSVFRSQFKEVQCIGRKEFRKKLQDDLDAQSWNGIIFISGRIQMGKSTAIMSVLQGRKYVAYVDWSEEKNFNSLTSDKLNEKLKGAFNLNLIGDDIVKFMNKLSFGPLNRIYLCFYPTPESEKCKQLEQTLREIEKILQFAKDNNLPRPVIFLDEIGALDPLLKNQQTEHHIYILFGWLMSASKEQLCDVIVVDRNGWAITNFLEPKVDPIYIRSLVLEDMDSADIDEILKDMPRELRDHRQAQELLNDVGGHGMHLIRLARSKSLEEMQSTYQKLLLREARYLQNLYDSCQPCPWSWGIWGNKRLEVCVEKREIDAILEAFLRRVRDGNGDPKVHVNRLAHEAKVSVRTLKYLGTKNLLYFNPVEQTVSVRNKLLLRVCQLKKQKAAEAAELERAMGKYIVILNPIPIMVDGKNVARVPSPDERAEAERQLELIEELYVLFR
jgi:hypothetical protein